MIEGLPEELPSHVRTVWAARDWLRDQYRQQGFTVLPEPTPDDVPADLAEFHLDMLARRGEEHVAILIRRRTDISDNNIALAQALENRPGWLLDLVVLPVAVPVFASAPNPEPEPAVRA
jgi:REase_AHJR-like